MVSSTATSRSTAESNQMNAAHRCGPGHHTIKVNNVGAEITSLPTYPDPTARCGDPLGTRRPSTVDRGDWSERRKAHDTQRTVVWVAELPEFAGLTLYLSPCYNLSWPCQLNHRNTLPTRRCPRDSGDRDGTFESDPTTTNSTSNPNNISGECSLLESARGTSPILLGSSRTVLSNRPHRGTSVPLFPPYCVILPIDST